MDRRLSLAGPLLATCPSDWAECPLDDMDTVSRRQRRPGPRPGQELGRDPLLGDHQRAEGEVEEVALALLEARPVVRVAG